MTLLEKPQRRRIRRLTRSQARDEFDRQTRKLLGISGEEFLRRWDAGEYADEVDSPEHPELTYLSMLAPIAR